MGTSLIQTTQPDDDAQALAVALATNRVCYSSITGRYVSSGADRAVQAERWLEPLWKRLSPAARTVLEIGSADGVLTGRLAHRDLAVTAVEFSPTMAAATRKAAPFATVLEQEFLTAELPRSSFDVILANAVVHLFPPPHDAGVLLSIATLLAPMGLVFVSTTVEKSYSTGYEIKADDSRLKRYRTRYRPTDMRRLLDRCGFLTLEYYEEPDRLESGKIWGNWVLSLGGASR